MGSNSTDHSPAVTGRAENASTITMSGYRNLHRERMLDDEAPIWQVQAVLLSQLSDEWTMFVAAADGIVRVFRAREKEASDDLDASALSLTCTHALLGAHQVFPPPSQTNIGCSQCQVVRNYIGDDTMAGTVVVVGLDFAGKIRVWTFPDDELSLEATDFPKQVRSQQEFVIDDATGTLMAVCPPKLSGSGDVLVAVACLDGNVAMVALGVATPNAKNEPSVAGSNLGSLGSGAIPLSLCWHPTERTIAVGRSDGLVEIMHSTRKGHHRLTHHSEPVRAIDYTPDGSLLVTCSDGGHLAVWDVVGVHKTLVHHVVHAHTSWILDIQVLADSRRFATSGADGKIHVWQLDTMYAPTHTFHTDQSNWAVAITEHMEPQRLVTGSDKGWVQVFSIDG